MKTKVYSFIAAAIFMAATAFTSCKKSGPEKQQANLLTSAAWKASSREWLTVDGRWVAAPSWASAKYPATLTLFENGTYSTGTSSGTFGTWQVNSDRTQLTLLASGGSSTTATIASLSSSSLQLSTALRGDYIIEGTAAKPVYTDCTTDRTTFTH